MAIAVTSDASAFKRSANAPSQTAYSLWGWFNFSSVTPARFWGPLGLYAGSDGAPTSHQFHQISSASSGSANLTLGWATSGGLDTATTFFTASASTWYFIAMACSGTGAGNLIAYVRAITANSFTTATNSSAMTAFTPARMEWGRDAFTGDFISGSIHACGCADAALSANELLELSYFHEPQLDGIRNLNVFYPTIESVNTNATIDRSGNGRNATATVGSLADSPPLLWRAIPPGIPMPSASSISGTLAQTLGALTAVGAGSVNVDGTLAKTLGAATSTGQGAVDVAGTLAKTLDAVTATGAGAVNVDGTLAKTLGDLTCDADGTVVDPAGEITGTLDKTLAAVTAAGTGTVTIDGTLAKTLADATAVGTGTVTIEGTLAKTLAPLTLVAAGDNGDVGPAANDGYPPIEWRRRGRR